MLLGRTWVPACRLLQLKFAIIVYRMCMTCFRFFQLHCSYLCNTTIFALYLPAGRDVKKYVCGTRDKVYQACCTNFILQSTNAQGLGMRLAWCSMQGELGTCLKYLGSSLHLSFYFAIYYTKGAAICDPLLSFSEE